MKIGHMVRTLAAGAAFYVAMAACAAADSSIASGGGGTGPEGGASDDGHNGMGDAITNPVPDARAQGAPTPPEVATEPCDKTWEPVHYAEHAYPGMSAAEIALNVVAIVESSAVPPGYAHQIVRPQWVKDGVVAVSCGNAPSATFVRRR